jgi:hypothetical protein
MTIDDIGRRFTGPAGSEPGRETEQASRIRPVTPARPATASDHVELSDEGRILARLAERAEELGLSPERLAEIQERLADGSYHRPEMIDVVARRILDSGDL